MFQPSFDGTFLSVLEVHIGGERFYFSHAISNSEYSFHKKEDDLKYLTEITRIRLVDQFTYFMRNRIIKQLEG